MGDAVRGRPSSPFGRRQGGRGLVSSLLGLVVLSTLGAVAVAVAFWPGTRGAELREDVSVTASVVGVVSPSGEVVSWAGGDGSGKLVWVVSRLDSELPGRSGTVPSGSLVFSLVWTADMPEVSPGTRVRVASSSFPPPFDLPDVSDLAGHGSGELAGYVELLDFERSGPLSLLAAIFVVSVVAVGRWWGVRSLVGLAASLALVLVFLVPAVLSGAPAPLVAWSAAMLIMVLTLYVTHGFSLSTTVAAAGTTLSLAVTVALGHFFVGYAQISGFASDNALAASLSAGGLDLSGLVLAGLIIATLGVLDDVTVSQTSTVAAIARADGSLSARELFSRAMVVGRDHIGAVVNTLFLAYTGASLALLVLFETSGLSSGELVSSEVVAEEVVKTLVGSIGLVLAVPLTTALAALAAARSSYPLEGAAPAADAGGCDMSPEGYGEVSRPPGRTRPRATGSLGCRSAGL